MLFNFLSHVNKFFMDGVSVDSVPRHASSHGREEFEPRREPSVRPCGACLVLWRGTAVPTVSPTREQNHYSKFNWNKGGPCTTMSIDSANRKPTYLFAHHGNVVSGTVR